MFSENDVIYAYTREQAIQDGVLVDVSKMAAEAGYKVPVAITAALYNVIDDIPNRYINFEDFDGRLWDVLWMGLIAARNKPLDHLLYKLILHYGRKTYITLKMVIGPGDNGEPVITIMLPDED